MHALANALGVNRINSNFQKLQDIYIHCSKSIPNGLSGSNFNIVDYQFFQTFCDKFKIPVIVHTDSL